MAVVFDRVDLAIPFWRPYLRPLLGNIKVLHIWSLSHDERGFIQDLDFTFSMGLQDGDPTVCCQPVNVPMFPL